MSAIASPAGIAFDATADVLIIGAGAAGLIAALAAKAEGAEPVIVERDARPAGSTALSAGLIPAAGTRFQARQGIVDGVEDFRRDILAKSHGASNHAALDAALAAVAPALEWLAGRYGLAFNVIADFRYPGHSAHRMHALPRRTGAELIDALAAAVASEGIAVLTGARATTLYADTARHIHGIAVSRRDGSLERIGCRTLVLACSGYGGNAGMRARYLPEMRDALWFGHSGNDGDAVAWGEALGAGLADMTGHQGHGSVATPHGILITWATISEGGWQVDSAGRRFCDESHGYSEQGAIVLAQPGKVAWSIFDARIAAIARQFEDFRNAEAQGAVLAGKTMTALAATAGLPAAALEATLAAVEPARQSGAPDTFGRVWRDVAPLAPPYHAVKVTGALFHTQGGLAIDTSARVCGADGRPFPNLFAAGGAAVGVSGPAAAGYLSGNGLFTAVGLGRLAGSVAARQVRGV